jgi:hypothetical protein
MNCGRSNRRSLVHLIRLRAKTGRLHWLRKYATRRQAGRSLVLATDDREKLAKRGADPLASFIVSLAHDSSGVGDLVRTHIALDIPKVSARIVRDSVE